MTSASVSRDVAVSQAADTRRSVNASISQQVIALAAAHTQVAISEARRRGVRYRGAARGAGEVQVRRLTSWSTSKPQRSNLAQAQVNLVQARFSYRTALATLAALLGKDM